MTTQAKEILYHIQKWLNEKTDRIYQEIAAVELQYAPANRWMSYEEASNAEYAAIAEGEQWGRKWEYGWFRGKVVIPAEAAGSRVELLLRLGGESTVYVDGRTAGAIDQQHKRVTLTRHAAGGESCEIVAEAYAGHEGGLPVLGRSAIVIVNEELYQFYMDLNTLYQLRNGLDDASLRVSEIDRAFRKLLALIDWSVEPSELEQLVREGRGILAPLLACVNGSTSPKLFMMGQSHLDVAWLWPLEETKRKMARTLSNQLALLDEYPEYRYTQSQPFLFRMVKQLYPELYDRIKDAVEQGRIIPEGGMWLEPDTVIPSGESLIRQFIHGKRFFKEEFGMDNRFLWLPDVFGYSGNLPQIMRKCGIEYFASVKMNQTYDNVADPFPYNTFTWEGIDGSKVLAHMLDYGPFPNPADVSYALLQWNGRIQRDGISTRLVQFGYGDGGGGANRDDLEFLRRMKNLEGAPRTVIASPLDYFEDLTERGVPDAHYAGELYYPAHRGTLTSQAAMKQGNRQTEFALREAELWSATAALLQGSEYPAEELDRTWKQLLLNQFHDILPGTSIARVHREAALSFQEALGTANRLAEEAARALTDGSEAGLTVFNSLPWDRSVIVPLPMHCRGAAGPEGAALPVQQREDQLFVRVDTPALACVTVTPSAASVQSADSGLRVAERLLENRYMRLLFNEYGEITSIYNKETNSEWAAGVGNQFLMYRDHPSSYDAWEIDRRYEEARLELPEPATVTVLAGGPLFAALRIERKLNQSFVVQEVVLEADGRRAEFRTQIDWREKHKLLKVGFDVALHAREALHEIQFGYVKRPTHRSRPHDADRYETSQHKWSMLTEGDRCFSLLNDCKYGLSVNGGNMNLTLLRSPAWPDEQADMGKHRFTYAIHMWAGGFMSNPVIREAYEMQRPPLAVQGKALHEEGLLACDHPQLVVDTVKLAEDGSGDWIARIYEAKGAAATGALHIRTGAGSVRETDMLEEQVVAECNVIDNTVSLTFKPFEVKTLRMSQNG